MSLFRIEIVVEQPCAVPPPHSFFNIIFYFLHLMIAQEFQERQLGSELMFSPSLHVINLFLMYLQLYLIFCNVFLLLTQTDH